jgi:glutathione S-transferase
VLGNQLLANPFSHMNRPTLYHCRQARSFRVLWMLEELEMQYELRLLPFPPRVHAREYLAINPLGTVPYFIDGEARMTESSMICEYLAQRSLGLKLHINPDEPGYAAYLNYIGYGEATLTFPLAIQLRYGRFEPEERRLPQAAEDYRRFFAGRLKWIEGPLESREYLCGDRFTAADISVGYALLLGKHVGVDDLYQPQLKDYLARLEARPGFARAVEAEGGAGGDPF